MTGKGSSGSDAAQPQSHAAPTIRVTRGEPTAEELGALVAVLASAAAGAVDSTSPAGTAAGSPWSSPALMHRHPIAEVGPGAWQRSLR